MKNIEKYEKEIIQYDGRFAVTKEGQVVNCSGFDCKDCLFLKGCTSLKMRWLMKEYKEPLLSDEGINYLMTLILPYGLNELESITKINLYADLKYKLCVHLKDCVITVYFQRGTELCQWFDNLEKGKYYNAKELGLC